MGIDYVRPPFAPDGTLNRDRDYFRELGPTRLFVRWRGESKKNITIVFLIARIPEGTGAVASSALEIVDVSHRVARLIGSKVDTQGGARVRLQPGGVLATVADAVMRTSEQVWGSPDGFTVKGLDVDGGGP